MASAQQAFTFSFLTSGHCGFRHCESVSQGSKLGISWEEEFSLKWCLSSTMSVGLHLPLVHGSCRAYKIGHLLIPSDKISKCFTE